MQGDQDNNHSHVGIVTQSLMMVAFFTHHLNYVGEIPQRFVTKLGISSPPPPRIEGCDLYQKQKWNPFPCLAPYLTT